VLADALSESTFLLFWTWGFWSALRFLKHGSTVWLLASIGLAGLAYLTRPEGLLLPVALVSTLGLMTAFPTSRLSWPKWSRAVGLLVVGPLVLLGPYVTLKGGIGTKPAVARLLGLAPRSPAKAVERERPLDPDQSIAMTYTLAGRALARAVLGAVTVPLLLLAALSLLAPRPGLMPEPYHLRKGLFLMVTLGAGALALVRLHATGGYCTPRHTMIIAFPVIAAAAKGLNLLVERIANRCLRTMADGQQNLPRLILWALFLVAELGLWARDTLAPINGGYQGYRQAGEWLAIHAPADARVLDLKGWAIFYGQRAGYTFERLEEGMRDPKLGWVVAHDAFLVGPWDYCQAVRRTVGSRVPIKSFPEIRRPGISQVHIFDLSQKLARSETRLSASSHR
jgi:hypothetical protein